MSSSSMSSSLPGTTRPRPPDGTVWLRRALWVDVLFSGAAGVAMGAGHALLAPVLGLPEALLIGAALVCLAWAAALGVLARRPYIARPLVWGVVVGNGAWVAASVALLVFGWVQPSAGPMLGASVPPLQGVRSCTLGIVDIRSHDALVAHGEPPAPADNGLLAQASMLDVSRMQVRQYRFWHHEPAVTARRAEEGCMVFEVGAVSAPGRPLP